MVAEANPKPEEEQHECKCNCGGCPSSTRGKDIKKWEEEQLQEHKFFWHYVPPKPGEAAINIHTHGLEQTLKHLDLQLVAPIDLEVCAGILHDVVLLIKEGLVLKSGEDINNVLKGMPVGVLEVSEDDRKVMRLILPDEKGNVTSGLISPPWDIQFEAL